MEILRKPRLAHELAVLPLETSAAAVPVGCVSQLVQVTGRVLSLTVPHLARMLTGLWCSDSGAGQLWLFGFFLVVAADSIGADEPGFQALI